eukprot:jgi/Mesvir1/6654/Mv08634-RA.1
MVGKTRANGKLSIMFQGVSLTGLSVAVYAGESAVPIRPAATSSKASPPRNIDLDKGDRWIIALGDQASPVLEAALTFRPCGEEGDGLEVSATLKNVSKDIVRVKKVLLASHDSTKTPAAASPADAASQGPLILPGSPDQWWLYRHAWSSISLSHAVKATTGTEATFFSPVVRPTLLPTFARHQLYDTEDDVRQPDGEFRSEGFVVLGKEGGAGDDAARGGGGVSVAVGASNPRAFNVGVHLDGIPLEAGESVSLGGLALFASGAGSQAAMLRLFDAWSLLARPVPNYERGDVYFTPPVG